MQTLKTGFLSALAIGFCLTVASAKESAQYKNLLTPLLQTETDILEQPVVYPPGKAKITAAIVTIPAGGKTGWHSHEVPLFVYVLDGAVTVDYGDKGVKTYKASEAVMEAMDWPHNGMNNGDAPVRLLVVYMGSDEKANTESMPGPQ